MADRKWLERNSAKTGNHMSAAFTLDFSGPETPCDFPGKTLCGFVLAELADAKAESLCSGPHNYEALR
jgi:hypothetical protein